MQFQAPRGIPLPQVERRLRRHIQQAGVFALALDPVMAPGQRRAAVMRDVPIEVLVFLVGDFAAWPRPQRLRLVHGLEIQRRGSLLRHQHGECQVV